MKILFTFFTLFILCSEYSECTNVIDTKTREVAGKILHTISATARRDVSIQEPIDDNDDFSIGAEAKRQCDLATLFWRLVDIKKRTYDVGVKKVIEPVVAIYDPYKIEEILPIIIAACEQALERLNTLEEQRLPTKGVIAHKVEEDDVSTPEEV